MDLCLYSLRLKKQPLSTKPTFSPIVPFVTLSTLLVFSHSSHLSCLSLVFFPVRVSLHNSPLSKVFFFPPSSHSLRSPPVHLIPHSHFPFPECFSLTLCCLSHRDREEVWVDSSCSHLCSPIGQRWSGAAGEWANHGVCPSSGRQWPERKWPHPCLAIWPAVGYVLTERQKCSLTF